MKRAYLLGCAALCTGACGTAVYDMSEASYQRGMDPVRIEHIDYLASLIGEFIQTTGRMPLADRVEDKRVTVFITHRHLDSIYLEQAARLPVIVLSTEDLKADLERGLGRTMKLPSDPQNFASFAPNLYIYDVNTARACVYGHLFFEVPAAVLVEFKTPGTETINRYYKYGHCIASSVRSLQLDAAASTQSPTVQADRVILDLLTWPETINNDGQGLSYAVAVNIYAAAGSPRGRLAAIEVGEAVLEIRYSDASVSEITLSTVADDWNEERGQFGRFMLPQSKTPRFDVDFQRLKDVRFRLKFIGVYIDGGRREYWLERYLRPKVITPQMPLSLTE